MKFDRFNVRLRSEAPFLQDGKEGSHRSCVFWPYGVHHPLPRLRRWGYRSTRNRRPWSFCISGGRTPDESIEAVCKREATDRHHLYKCRLHGLPPELVVARQVGAHSQSRSVPSRAFLHTPAQAPHRQPGSRAVSVDMGHQPRPLCTSFTRVFVIPPCRSLPSNQTFQPVDLISRSLLPSLPPPSPPP